MPVATRAPDLLRYARSPKLDPVAEISNVLIGSPCHNSNVGGLEL